MVYYDLSGREAFAWALVIILSFAVMALTVALTVRRPIPPPADPVPEPSPPSPSWVELTPNSGIKSSVTLTHHGPPTKYYVDGRIVLLLKGSANPNSTIFRCELQVAGLKGEWAPVLNDGEWANIVLCSIEPIQSPGWGGELTTTGDGLVIRRGKVGTHVRVPDSGAMVELKIRTEPPLTHPTSAKRYEVIRAGSLTKVTLVPEDDAEQADE
jgi:hypothetical protein